MSKSVRLFTSEAVPQFPDSFVIASGVVTVRVDEGRIASVKSIPLLLPWNPRGEGRHTFVLTFNPSVEPESPWKWEDSYDFDWLPLTEDDGGVFFSSGTVFPGYVMYANGQLTTATPVSTPPFTANKIGFLAYRSSTVQAAAFPLTGFPYSPIAFYPNVPSFQTTNQMMLSASVVYSAPLGQLQTFSSSNIFPEVRDTPFSVSDFLVVNGLYIVAPVYTPSSVSVNCLFSAWCTTASSLTVFASVPMQMGSSSIAPQTPPYLPTGGITLRVVLIPAITASY